jgi:CheY-like chemotaxis protein
MTVVVLTGDLTVIARVQGAATKAGVPMRAASSEMAAIELCVNGEVDTLVIDLSASLRDVAAFVAQVKATASAPRIVAFGPHVHEARLAAAREAGCDEVVSRGQFFAQMDGLLRP